MINRKSSIPLLITNKSAFVKMENMKKMTHLYNIYNYVQPYKCSLLSDNKGKIIHCLSDHRCDQWRRHDGKGSKSKCLSFSHASFVVAHLPPFSHSPFHQRAYRPGQLRDPLA